MKPLWSGANRIPVSVPLIPIPNDAFLNRKLFWTEDWAQPNNLVSLWQQSQGWIVSPSFRPVSLRFLPFHFDWLSPLLYSVYNLLWEESDLPFSKSSKQKVFAFTSIPFLKWKWAVLSHFLFCTSELPVQKLH